MALQKVNKATAKLKERVRFTKRKSSLTTSGGSSTCSPESAISESTLPSSAGQLTETARGYLILMS